MFHSDFSLGHEPTVFQITRRQRFDRISIEYEWNLQISCEMVAVPFCRAGTGDHVFCSNERSRRLRSVDRRTRTLPLYLSWTSICLAVDG